MYDLKDANAKMVKLLRKGRPFLVTRLGGETGRVACSILLGRTPHERDVFAMQKNAGIYCNSTADVSLYAQMYNRALRNSTYLACFPHLCTETQHVYRKTYSLKALHNRVLEPFHCVVQGISPWSQKLIGKKVLVVSPFARSMREQMDAGFRIFRDIDIFSAGQAFLFYKAYCSLAGHRPHESWVETFQSMCRDIAKLDFDVALLGCGGYGLPLCDFIYSTMGKSAVYVGGGLQLLFGVMGKRWVENDMWKKIIRENHTRFVRPSGDEVPTNKQVIEGGCYW